MNTTFNTREEILECNIKALTELIKDLMIEQGQLRSQVIYLTGEVSKLKEQLTGTPLKP